jgi:hypothetical protein
MENLCFSDLVRLEVDQIRSEAVPGLEDKFQEAIFTLPPNHINSPHPLDSRQISVVSSNENSGEGESPEDRRLRLHCNSSHPMRCETDIAIAQGGPDLCTANGRNPRVAPPRPSPPAPRNLDDDFILECDGQQVFTTPLGQPSRRLRCSRGNGAITGRRAISDMSPRRCNSGPAPEEGLLRHPNSIHQLAPLDATPQR